MITRYVLGFAFHDEAVLLIEKKRGPTPVIGKLNGIGGRYEAKDESIRHAMSREFLEETGLHILVDRWKPFADLRIHKYEAMIHCYKAELVSCPHIQSPTDEMVSWYLIRDVPYLNIVPNLKWLVPLAKDKDDILADISDTTR